MLPQFPNISNYNEADGSILDYCTSRGFPLGGIGTGGFNILTDGGFGKFRTNHNWFQFVDGLDFPKGTFIAIRVQRKNEIVSRILRKNYHGGEEFHNIQSIAHTKFIGKIPSFSLEYTDEKVPIDMKLYGFSSLIPQNLKDSSLPIGNFGVYVRNNTEEIKQISLLFSFENILGLGGSGGKPILIRDGPVKYRSTKSNYCEIFDNNSASGLIFKTAQQYKENNPRRRVLGEYYLYTDSIDSKNVQLSRCIGWSSKDSSPSILSDFHRDGTIQNDYSPTERKSKNNSGGICINFFLAPKTEKTIHFYLCWWTPNHVIEKNQRLRHLIGIHNGVDFGHYYLNFFQNPMELIEYGVLNRKRMELECEELEKILKNSSLPDCLQTYILNSADVILVNTCLDKKGNYYMIEGCPWDWPYGGLTGTIDMRLVSHPYSSIFLTKFDIAELKTFRDLTMKGDIPHGNGHCDVKLHSSNVPYGRPLRIYKWIRKAKAFTDLPQSFIIQLGKMAMITGDFQLIKDSWDTIVEMLERLNHSLLDGIPNGITTYDYADYSPHFIYSAVMHLATMKMAKYLGQKMLDQHDISQSKKQAIHELISSWQEQFVKCEKTMYERLWKERGYFQSCSIKDTIFVSGLAGEWAMNYCGLPPNIDLNNARSYNDWQLKTLYQSHDFIIKKGRKSRPLVYREADLEGNEIWMKGNLVQNENQVNNPYQALGYFGLESIYLGRVEEGLGIIKRIWDKGYYEGYPWDMDHWGFPGHLYMSHPIMWAVFNALTGVSLNLLEKFITFSPRLLPNQDKFKIPVFFPHMWLWVSYFASSKRAKIEIIKSFKLGEELLGVECIALDGERKKINFENPLQNQIGEVVEFEYPF